MSQSRVTQLAEPVSDRDHTQGPADAPVTLVMYGDYECSYCQEAFRAVKQLREDETVTEQARFVFRNFPLTSVHPHAQQAAEAAEAAAAQGQFWEMHDVLYEHQDALELEDLQEYAEQVGLDGEYLVQELEQGGVHRARPGGSPERRTQRGERHADVLHQRRTVRRAVGPRCTPGCARRRHLNTDREALGPAVSRYMMVP